MPNAFIAGHHGAHSTYNKNTSRIAYLNNGCSSNKSIDKALAKAARKCKSKAPPKKKSKPKVEQMSIRYPIGHYLFGFCSRCVKFRADICTCADGGLK